MPCFPRKAMSRLITPVAFTLGLRLADRAAVDIMDAGEGEILGWLRHVGSLKAEKRRWRKPRTCKAMPDGTMQQQLMQMVVPERFHARPRRAHPGMIHGHQPSLDETVKIGAATYLA